jgi:hypothetical protein
MYGSKYRVLLEVATDAFGNGMRLCHAPAQAVCDGCDVVVFGKRWGKELRLPSRIKGGGYFVDWILARLGQKRTLEEFVAVEAQTMDTTGSYEAQVHRFLKTGQVLQDKQSNINWENVSKRILPQLIFKGHVLRQEKLCRKGIYFVCPSPVYERILVRPGGTLRPYHPQPGALTFRHYDVSDAVLAGQFRELVCKGQMTTTVDQVTLAFP